ncbi:hypothetical protein RUM44_003069 [Polyplax serrata]|uniref:Uncharacterized protein n=1 Tax=Polyplax serrata TaxID=468196 RepID=A0ABR1AXG8_POLSC
MVGAASGKIKATLNWRYQKTNSKIKCRAELGKDETYKQKTQQKKWKKTKKDEK